jgi:cytochrome c peroxidase
MDHRRGLALCASVWLSLPSAPTVLAQEPRFTLPATTVDYRPVRGPAAIGLEPSRERDRPSGDGDEARANELTALGRVLFYDPLLSRNRSISCGSCHQQAKAFTDGRARSVGFRGDLTRRSAMSLSNLGARESGFFWDARVQALEEMVLRPIQDPVEMGLDLDELERRVAGDADYRPLFRKAFGDEEVSRARIGSALATFVRALVSRGSRYDAALAAATPSGDGFSTFTPEESRGMRLFFHACSACHLRESAIRYCPSCVIQGLNDVAAPALTNIGLDLGSQSDDPGLGGVTGKAEDHGRFRAPTLRNIELTAPYMHDGRFATLEEVLRFYASRVRPHPGLDPRLEPGGGASWPAPMLAHEQTRLGLALTPRDQADLIAFLKTLTDRDFVTDPRFADPFPTQSRR